MPPITSSRAGTRVTQISPAVKKLARPEASLLGFCRSCSNSEISNGVSAFMFKGFLTNVSPTLPNFFPQVTPENLMVMMAEESLAVAKQIPDDENVQRQNDQHRPGKMPHQFMNLDGDEERRFADGQPAGPGHAENQT